MSLARPTVALLFVAGAVVCAASCAHTPGTAHVASEARAQDLPLDRAVAGSTAGWDWRDGAGGDVWRFVAPATASYRFSASGDGGGHVPSIDIYFRDSKRIPRTLGSTMNSLTVPLEPGVYYVNVDGNRVDRGAYRLDVRLDTTPGAAIRPEDPSVVEPLCARAASIGETPALGTFESRSGGARAACGGTGGGAIYVLEVEQRSRVTLDAAAQFKVALEVRAACLGQPAPGLACAKGEGYQATLSATLDPGRYFVVLDSSQVGSLKTGVPASAVRGAYSLRARVQRQEETEAR